MDRVVLMPVGLSNCACWLSTKCDDVHSSVMEVALLKKEEVQEVAWLRRAELNVVLGIVIAVPYRPLPAQVLVARTPN